jgi:GNAT superfamily N-acetyltransferase
VDFSNRSSVARIAGGIEHIEAEAWAQLQLALPSDFRARMGCQVRRYGGAVSLLTSGADVATVNQTIGLGFEHELTDDQLAVITASYAAAGIGRWLVHWSPEAKPRAADALFARRGGRAMTPTVKLWRTLQDDLPVMEQTELRVVEIGAEDAATFEATVAEPLGIPRIMAPVIRSTVGDEHWRFYLALDGARPIAGAAMFVRDEGAWFGLSATTPSERGRGAQTALLARRLRDAAALGCTWVSADTQPETPRRPNPSYRNMCRAGMGVLYHRPKYLFEVDARTQPVRPST